MTQTPVDLPAARLTRATHPVAARLGRAGALSACAALLWVPQAALVAWLFATLLDDAAAAGGTTLLAAGGFAGLGLLRTWVQLIADRILAEAADAVLARERAALVAREGRRSPMAVGPGSAVIAALASEKLATLTPYLTRYRPAQLRVAVVPLATLVVSAAFSWVVAVILLIAGPLIPVFMALVGMAAREASERQMDEVGTLNGMLMERLQALIDIRLLDARDTVAAQFETRAEALRERTMAVLRVAFLSSTVLELFSALGVALVAVYVGFALLGTLTFGAWTTPLTAGEGIFLLLLAPEFFQPLRDLAAAWHEKAAAAAVARDLVELEAAAPAEIVGTDGGDLAIVSGAPVIATRRISVALSADSRLVFPDLEIHRGESCALVGASGRGKSTLLAALAGLVPVAAGEIVVFGVALDAASAGGWRRQVGWIPQAPHFFAASLRVNLLQAAPDADASEIAAALEIANVGDIVGSMPRGLLTRLGESGTGVSGGEARRLMVARAALARTGVILADEPTANLDMATAAAVTDGLLALAARGATLVVATHDETLAARLDRRIDLGAAS